MWEFLTGIVVGYVLTWPALCIFGTLAVIVEHNDASGWSTFFALIFAVIGFNYFSIQLTLTDVGLYALTYLFLGFIWSFWRYRKYVVYQSKDIAERVERSSISKADAKFKLEALNPRCNVDRIAWWVINWPASFIGNTIGDIIDTVQMLIKTVFRKAYSSIFNGVTAQIQEKIEQLESIKK